ncbi:MAG TPA: BTAD domain-containing putative transcriptional regulator [Longimicrobium sp.]
MKSFRLKLFGGAVLEDESGIVGGRAAHRRRLALLALLAVGRGPTVGRERLMALLWPEKDDENARHLLSESLYVLRKRLGEGALVAAGNELGVDPAVVACDVAAFDEAIAAGREETAVGLYAGPFLDGFYVDDAPEFERWAEGERDRLARAYAEALETLAERREGEGEWKAAAEWWRRLFRHDPYKEPVVLRLMTALEATGERAEGLKVAAEHVRLMREDLGAKPSPAVEQLAERLRSDPGPAEAPARAPSPPISVPVPVIVAAPEPDPPAADPVAGQGTAEEVGDGDAIISTMPQAGDAIAPDDAIPVTRRRRRPLMPLLAAAAVLAATAAAVWVRLRPQDAAAGVTVAVFSFEAAGDARDAPADAGELQGLFSSAFTLVPGLWTVDATPRTEARGWREVPLEELKSAARAKGARYAAVPEVISTSPLRISVSVREVQGWTQVARESSAPGEPPGGAVQRIGLRLARAVAQREHIDVGPAAYLLTASDSAAALSHFMLGTSSFRAGDPAAAAQEFRAAVKADPLCLLASHRLSVVLTWSPEWKFKEALQAVDSGLAHRDQARSIDVQLLEAQRLLIVRHGSEAVQRFTRITVNDPSMLDGWFGKGEAVFHFEGMLGGRPEDALSAFEQVVRMDSTYSPVYEHLSEIAIRLGDRERAERYAPRVRSPEAPQYQLGVALRFGDDDERASMLAALDTTGRSTVSNVARIFSFDPRMVDTLGTLLMRRSEVDDRRWGASFRIAALTAQGKWPRALQIWRTLPPAPFDKWLVHARLAGYPSPEGDEMLRYARTFVEEEGPDFGVLNARTRDPFRAVVHLALLQGDSAEVAFLLQRLDAAEPAAGAWNPEPGALRATLRARQALLAGDTATAIRRLQEALERAPWWISAFAPLADAAPERLLLAQLLAAQGRPSEAEIWLNSFGNVGAVGDLIYRPAVERLRAQIRARRPAAAAHPAPRRAAAHATR